MNSSTDDFPLAQECFYTSHYCEENIWKLCELVNNKNHNALDNCYCVFISNEAKITPLWHQKAGTGNDFFVSWDYHVILVRRNKHVSVYDFDSTLGFPVSFSEYIEKTIGLKVDTNPKYYRFFRLIPAKDYLKLFSSDRSHMKNFNGEWLKPPPPYDPIQSNESKYNLNDFICMEIKKGPGIVMDLAGFIDFFRKS